MRRSVVTCVRWLRRFGTKDAEAERLLGVSGRTLERWECSWKSRRLPLVPRGRPVERAPREARAALIEAIDEEGRGVGVPTLKSRFPALARREIEWVKARHVWVLRRRERESLYRLTWTRPGAVWAIDFAHPPRPIEGLYTRLLCVRDLASHYQLATRAVLDETAEEACAVLAELFARHGPPLVLKADNGSAFIAESTASLLRGNGVFALHSPVRCPSYNGSCEAGVGSMKSRAARRASHAGRPGTWLIEDLEGARLEANATARPWGERGPVPAEVWDGREPISRAERAALRASYRCLEREERASRGIPEGVSLPRATRAIIDRAALRRAMTQHGLLLFRRG